MMTNLTLNLPIQTGLDRQNNSVWLDKVRVSFGSVEPAVVEIGQPIAQLRFGYCSRLNSYFIRIYPTILNTACNAYPHDVETACFLGLPLNDYKTATTTATDHYQIFLYVLYIVHHLIKNRIVAIQNDQNFSKKCTYFF